MRDINLLIILTVTECKWRSRYGAKHFIFNFISVTSPCGRHFNDYSHFTNKENEAQSLVDAQEVLSHKHERNRVLSTSSDLFQSVLSTTVLSLEAFSFRKTDPTKYTYGQFHMPCN